jgi:hypothetical protein
MTTGIPTDSLMFLWPKVEPMLEPALGDGETTAQVLTALYKEEAQLWCIFDNGVPLAAVVTQIGTGRDGKTCNIWAAGGEGINRWLDFLPMIEDWAAENGCNAVTIDRGRRGWQRLLTGYKVTHVTLKKDI